MPMKFPILAVLLTMAIPVAVAVGVFLAVLSSWIDKILRLDPAMHEHLKLEVSEGCVAWAIVSEHGAFHRWPYLPLTCAALAAVSVALVQTALFASGSSVPFLWYLAGSIASVIALLTPFVLAGLFPNALRSLVDRMLRRRADDMFAYANRTIVEIGEIARQIEASYAQLGLHGRTDAMSLCRSALLKYGSLGNEVAATELIGIKIRCDYDLRCLQYCAHLLMDARTLLAQAKVDFQNIEATGPTIEQIEGMMTSRELTDALEEPRWTDAKQRLEQIRSDLGRLLQLASQDSEMPRSPQDAYRILNVNDDTPLKTIKAVVNALQRVWHPDQARDEIERRQRTLRMQQINCAWDIVRQAHVEAEVQADDYSLGTR
jgi:hypothetical protein